MTGFVIIVVLQSVALLALCWHRDGFGARNHKGWRR